MTEYKMKPGKLGETIIGAYEKIEDAVVGTYEKIEDSVVGTYEKIEDAFVDKFLEKVEESKDEEK